MRYFRKVVGLGDQVPFDAVGDSLDQSRYNRLGEQRGWVVDRGRLVRVRFASRVYLQGTRLAVAVRQSQPSTAWQVADGGDVTGLSPAKSLAISAQGTDAAIAQVAIAPNPFTPNGDGVNEVAEIAFSLFPGAGGAVVGRAGLYAGGSSSAGVGGAGHRRAAAVCLGWAGRGGAGSWHRACICARSRWTRTLRPLADRAEFISLPWPIK